MAKLFESAFCPEISAEEPPVVKVIREVGLLAVKLDTMYSVKNNENCKEGSKILKTCEKTICGFIDNRPKESSGNESHYDDVVSHNPVF